MDLVYAARVLRKNPAFAIPAIVALTLGIGAVTAIFSIVDTMLLRPLPYPESERLISVNAGLPGLRFTGIISSDYLDWRDRNHVFENFAAMSLFPNALVLAGPDGPFEVQASRVTANFLATLRVAPTLGRAITAEDEQQGRPAALLLSYSTWQNRFRGDPGVLGKSVMLDNTPAEVVGVLPKDFYFPQNTRVDVLSPYQIDVARTRARLSGGAWDSIARLKPGVSLEQARAEFSVFFAAARAAEPRMHRETVVQVVPYRERLTGNIRVTLWVLLGGVGCVLMIACANVANLLLARAAGREREISIRAALGANRLRLIRQLLIESLTLAFFGCAGGFAVAAGVISLLRAIAPADVPRVAELAVNLRSLLFAVALATITGLAFGLLPALAATRPTVRFARTGPRNLLVGAEVALSLILLVGAGLLFESLWRLQHKNLGFEPEHVYTSSLSIRGAALDELCERVAAIPGTRSVALADSFAPNGGSALSTFSREGRPLNQTENVVRRRVNPEYLKTLGIALRRGRLFTRADGNNVVILNETAVRRYFPGEDPIGKKIDTLQPLGPPKTVVGIVADAKNQGLALDAMPEAYGPLLGSERRVFVMVRSMGDPALVASLLRQQIRELDPAVPATIETIQQQFTEMTARPRFNGILFGSFAAIALALAMIGIYGVISFTVARRAPEIGIRIALGADSRNIVALFLKQAMLPVLLGIAAGLAASAALSRSLSTLLYDVRPVDAPTYAAVSIVLGSIAIAASIVPARRAARVDPMTILRSE